MIKNKFLLCAVNAMITIRRPLYEYDLCLKFLLLAHKEELVFIVNNYYRIQYVFLMEM